MSTTAPERRGDPTAEGAREHAGRVVHGVYRLVKGRLLHDESNQAIVQLVDALVAAVADYCAATRGDRVSVLFASNNVFVDRQMLRASRETYQLALELGQMLELFGVTELTLHHPLDRAEVQELGNVIALAQRDHALAQKDRLDGLQTVRARRVVAFAGGPQLTPVQRAARTYAASVLIVQSFYRQLREGSTELPHGVKRVAQRLVTSAEEDSRLLLVIAASPTAATDRAAAAVSTAILALAVARQLIADRSALLALASAAILYDVGRSRLARSSMSTVERSLGEAELEKLPASTVASLTVLGKLHQGSLARSVVAYEALALRLGTSKVYGGRRPPSVLARVLHAARVFVEARATQGPLGGAATSMDDAVQALFGQARDATERTYAKLVLGALGLFPAGTLVELTTGELAVVTATPRQPVDFARPPVRILYDRDANLLESPLDVDLAMPAGSSAPVRLIRRAVDADEQQMRQMRAYVAGLSTAASRTPRKEPPIHRDPPVPVESRPVRPPTGSIRVKATLPPRRPSGAHSTVGSGSVASGSVAPIAMAPAPPVSMASPPDVLAWSELPRAELPRAELPRAELPRAELPRAEPPGSRPPASAGSSSTGPSPTAPGPTSRPRRDPRSDDEADVQGAPDVAATPARRPSPPPGARGAPQVHAARAAPDATSASTRAMSWDQYGQIVDEAQADPVTRSVPPAPPEPTDALLAEYLDEAPSRGGGTHGLRGWGHEPPSQRDSSSARWGSDSRSGAPSSQGDSSRRDPPSAGGSQSSVSRAGWAAVPPSRRHGPTSDPAKPRSVSGRTRTSTKDWTTARAPGSVRASQPPRPPSQPPTPPPEPLSSVTGRKPKAGSQGWGTDKK